MLRSERTDATAFPPYFSPSSSCVVVWRGCWEGERGRCVLEILDAVIRWVAELSEGVDWSCWVVRVEE